MLLKGRGVETESTSWSPWSLWQVTGDKDENIYFFRLEAHISHTETPFVKSPECNHLSESRDNCCELASCVGSVGFPFCQQEAQDLGLNGDVATVSIEGSELT